MFFTEVFSCAPSGVSKINHLALHVSRLSVVTHVSNGSNYCALLLPRVCVVLEGFRVNAAGLSKNGC